LLNIHPLPLSLLGTEGHLGMLPALLVRSQVLRYEVGAIPPMETAEQVKAEEALTHPEDAAPPAAET